MFPTIAEYNQAIKSKGGNAFRTLSNLIFIPSRTLPVKIFSFGSGSYAVVFKAKENQQEYAIRCFISADQENIDRYRYIYKYLNHIKGTWITRIELLENEINISGNNYPIIKMDWVEGKLLNSYIDDILENNGLLEQLQEEIINISTSLEENKVGHGDIQCGNVIITKDKNGQSICKLIDYDGMYLPAFAKKRNLEKGRSEFQHPGRSQTEYNERIDRFSFWVILCALEALKFDKSLWLEVMQGGYNTLDNLLFTGDDFTSLNNSKLVKHLYALNKPSLNYYLNKLDKICHSPAGDVEFPALFDSGEISKPRPQPQPFNDKKSATVSIISKPSGAAVVNGAFLHVGSTPLTVEKSKFLNEILTLSYGTQFRKIQILENSDTIEVIFQDKKLPSVHVDNNLPPVTPDPIIAPAPTPVQHVSSDHSIQPLGQNNPQPKNKAFAWVIILLVIFTIIVVAIIKIRQNQYQYTDSYQESIKDSTASTTNMPADSTIASPEVDTTSSISNSIPADTTSAKVDSTYPAATESIASPSGYLDADYHSAKDVLKTFLEAFNNNDCTAAWNVTYNPAWEQKGKEWFCSYDAFGGIKKLYTEQLTVLSENSNEALIFAFYYTEDAYNGNKCFKQNFTIKKQAFTNNKTLWVIAKMKNIETPYPCELK